MEGGGGGGDLPAGGTTGQVLTKSSGTDFDTEWATPSAGSGVSDGDKGDITVSGSGSTWTIDNGAVSLAKQANMATASVVYRKSGGTGAPEVQSLATLKSDLGLTGSNSGDQTFIAPRTSSTTSTATLTVDADTTDQANITAQAVSLAIAAPTGTPVHGQKLIIHIKDDGTSRSIDWDVIFREFGAGKPDSTEAGKNLYVGILYNATDTKWDIVAVQQEI